MAEDVAASKAALKALSRRVKRPFISGFVGGHCLQEDADDGWYDGMYVAVSGYSTP
jgi:hypothetical protein